jgi:hypothetical protein
VFAALPPLPSPPLPSPSPPLPSLLAEFAARSICLACRTAETYPSPATHLTPQLPQDVQDKPEPSPRASPADPARRATASPPSVPATGGADGGSHWRPSARPSPVARRSARAVVSCVSTPRVPREYPRGNSVRLRTVSYEWSLRSRSLRFDRRRGVSVSPLDSNTFEAEGFGPKGGVSPQSAPECFGPP